MRVMAQPGAAEKRETVDSTRERELEEQHHDAIENLAHRLWIERGCPTGSAEIDWLEAEEKLAPRLIPSARGRSHIRGDEAYPHRHIVEGV